MADIRIIDMPDLDANIPQENIYLVVDEASQTYKVLVKNVAVPYTSAATHKQALIYSSATDSVEWGYVDGIPGGTAGQLQYNNYGILDGFGKWDGSRLTIPRITIQDTFRVGNSFIVSPIISAGYTGTTINFAPGTTQYKCMIQAITSSAGQNYLQLIGSRTGGIEFCDSENIYSRKVYANFGPDYNRMFVLTRADKGILLGNVDTPEDQLLYYVSAEGELKFQENGVQAFVISNPRELSYNLNPDLTTSGFSAYFHRNGKVSFSGVILSTTATYEITEGELLFTIDNSDAWPAQTIYLMTPVGSGTWTASKPDGISYLKIDSSGNVYMGSDAVNAPAPYVIWMDGVNYQSGNTITL